MRAQPDTAARATFSKTQLGASEIAQPTVEQNATCQHAPTEY